MSDLLQRLLTTGRFDLVQLESSQLASVATWGPAPWIIDEHNLEYELLQRMYEVEHSPLRKAYNWLEFKKFRGEELGAWRTCDACVLTSTREQRVFAAERPSTPSHVAPNGVDVELFVPSTDPPDPDNIVFTGLMSYRPNTDGAAFFVREVLPLILARRPSTRFNIVGLAAEQSVGFLAGPNVRVLSDVPDVRPYIRDAAVVAVPLRMGSGTRLKILEGLAMGKAIVSTTIGCEGIDVVDDRDMLIADEPAAFAGAVLRLLEDAEARHRLGAAGRTLAEERYSWASIVDALTDFHGDVLGSDAVSA
jgi:glycosyltransferase involved in cell wall biosynthesis